MKLKYFRFFVISVLICLIVFAFGTAQAKTYNFRFACTITSKMAHGDVGIFIADRLNTETNGRIKATFFHSGKMGGEVELFSKLEKGILQGALISGAISSNYGPVINLLNLPFFFPTQEAADKFRRSPLWDNIMQGLKKYKLTGLGTSEFGWYSIATVKPVLSFDQIQKERFKIRVPKSKMMIEYCKAMGLRPTPMPFPDIYSSLQQGVIDGLESSPQVMHLVKFDEVVKHIYLTRHFWGTSLFWVRDEFLNKLPNDLRKQFIQIVQEELEKSTLRALQQEKDALEAFMKEGIGVHAVSPEDRVKFVEAMQPVYEMFADSIGRDYLKKARILVNE